MDVLIQARRVAKRVAVPLFGAKAPARLWSRWNGSRDRVTILNLHRVCRDDGSSYEPLSPDLFRALLSFVVNTYEDVDFRALRESQDSRRSKPLAILSFDDGYKDFIEVAHPLLLKFGIRANLNVIPGCVESGQPPLNVALQDFIGKAPQDQVWDLLAILSSGESLDLSRNNDRLRLGREVSNYVKRKSFGEQMSLRSVVEVNFPGLLSKWSTPMLDADDVRFLSKSHEIGLHSYSHATMAMESEEFFVEDVRRCSEWSRSVLGQAPLIYAFPNGSYRASQIDVLVAAGFRDVLLVNEDFSAAEFYVHPRFTFHAKSISEVRFRATGALRA